MDDVDKKYICPWCGEFIGTDWGVVGSSMFPDNLYFMIKHFKCGKLIKQAYKTEWVENIAVTREEAIYQKLDLENKGDDIDEEFSEEEIELADAEFEEES